MKAVKARIVKAINRRAKLPVCDNSGAKIIQVISFRGSKTVKRRLPCGGVADFITASVIKGEPEMRKQVVNAVIVRQRKEYRRADGVRIKFEDNAAVVLKDTKGNPKGTIIKGPIAKEVAERWPAIAKLASIII